MAEDYGVSLKITADTSDLDRIPQKVEATRKEIEKPVEQTVEVTERRKTAAPVKHPAETVKVNVEQPAPVKITADTSSAETSITGFFGRFRRGVSAIRETISSVFAAFGMVTFVVGGVMALVAGFQKLRDMATATSRAIQQMRFETWLNGFNAAADAMIGKHQKIIAILKEEQDVANKAASLATMETSQDRAEEDASRNQVRQVQLAGATDPRERARLEDQFAAEDAEISRRRFEEDKKRKLAKLDEEQSIYQSKANGAASQIGNVDREIANQEDIVWRARKTIENGGEKEKYDKVIEEAKKRIESLKDEKKALEDLQKTAQREADYRGKQIEIVQKSKPSQSSSASNQLAAARNAAMDKQDQRAHADYTEDRDRRAADAEWDARFRAAQRRASAPDATEAQRNEAENTQLEMLRGKEDAAKAELEAAEKELAEEMAKDVKDRNEDRMARARERAARAQGDQISAARQREDISAQIENRRVTDAKDYFGNLAQQIDSSRPQNRLTAMGLGSGGPSDSTGREQISIQREIAKSLREAIAAIRAQNHGDGTAVYAP